MKRLLLASAALSLLATSALAQTSPGFTLGQVPTPAQWNTIIAGKADWPIGPSTTPITTPSIVMTTNVASPAAPVTAGHNWIFEAANATGTQTGATFNFNLIAVNDSVNANSNSAGFDNGFTMNWTEAAGWSGNRELLNTFLNVAASPRSDDPTGHVYVDSQMTAQGAAAVGGFALNNADAKGAIWGLDGNTILTAAATNWKEAYAAEFDIGIVAGGSVVKRAGSEVVLNANAAVPGTIIDFAYGIGAKLGETSPFITGFAFGNEAMGAWPFDSTSTLINATPRQIPATTASIPANYGIDWRAVTFTSGATAFPSAGINNIGDQYSGNLFVGSTITAQSGSIASIAPALKYGLTGGAYFGLTVLPTIAIEAPPNSGTPAAATTTHLQATQANLVTGTDAGCSNGDVLTASTSGAGTQATFTLTVAAGKATAVAITTPGDLTSAPGASPTTTGGTCSVQPNIHQGYGIKTVSVGTAGSAYLAYPLPYIIVSGSSNTENTPASLLATMSESTQSLTVASPVNFSSTLASGGTAGVTCASVSAATMTTKNGLVTHC